MVPFAENLVEKTPMKRRVFLLSCTSIASLSGVAAVGQLIRNVYSEAPRVRQALQNASSVEEVLAIAEDWNSVYKDSANGVDPSYASDWDIFVNAVAGNIKEELAKGAAGALAPALEKVAPKLLQAITTVSSYLNALSPVFVFLTAMTPSNIASDAVEIHQMNELMQEEISTSITRLTGSPDWYLVIESNIELIPTGPSIRMP